MKKTMLSLVVLIFVACLCHGQQLTQRGSLYLPLVTNDTLFLDVENVIKLKEKSPFISANGENLLLKIKNDELILMPTRYGSISVTFVYADKTEKRTFFCKPLPYPFIQDRLPIN